ncbi:sporulation protein [Halosimplex aquaticum]|uniref:Sporulation protein n=1 Tax=Halosimplex aquaticum TaxID=3026162 RepID=A0ABD5Y4N2_9EURY|nr:sporulation protein [Halosimplex aquaticum]
MREVLSSLGVGSATVDTILDEGTLHPGEAVDLTVEIEGGSTSQAIDAIYFSLETRYRSEDGGYETTAIQQEVAERSFTVEPDDHRRLDASMTLPRVTPLTKGAVDVWLKTGLEIDWAKDPQDRDAIEVVPTEKMAAVLEAVEGLGFAFSESDCKQASVYSPAPFVQEFEYEPTGSQWRRRVDELELIFAPLSDELEVRVEVDRRDSTYTDLTGGEERAEWYTVEHAQVSRLRDDMRALVNDNF